MAVNDRDDRINFGLAEVALAAVKGDTLDVASAAHEAGHAVATLALGGKVARVAIIPEGVQGGVCELGEAPISRMKAGIGLMAGGIAQRLTPAAHDPALAAKLRTGTLGDAELVLALWPSDVEPEGVVLQEMMDRSARLIVRHWRALVAITEALVTRRVLDGHEVHAIFAANVPMD